MKIEGEVFTLTKEELLKMITHKCGFCIYRAALCSEKNGCETGVKDYLQKQIDKKS